MNVTSSSGRQIPRAVGGGAWGEWPVSPVVAVASWSAARLRRFGGLSPDPGAIRSSGGVRTSHKAAEGCRSPRPDGLTTPLEHRVCVSPFVRERLVALGSKDASDLEALWDREWEKNLMDAATERVKRRINAEHYQIFHLLMIKRETPAKVADLLKVSKARLALVKHRVARLVRKEIAHLKQQPM
jgi:hypothetical protein